MAINTGMRQGEIFNLIWFDVDLARGLIHVRVSKNGKDRFVPINQTVRMMFQAGKAKKLNTWRAKANKQSDTRRHRIRFFNAASHFFGPCIGQLVNLTKLSVVLVSFCSNVIWSSGSNP